MILFCTVAHKYNAPLICRLMLCGAVFLLCRAVVLLYRVVFLLCRVPFLLCRALFLSAEQCSAEKESARREEKLPGNEGKRLPAEKTTRKMLCGTETLLGREENTPHRRKALNREDICSAEKKFAPRRRKMFHK